MDSPCPNSPIPALSLSLSLPLSLSSSPIPSNGILDCAPYQRGTRYPRAIRGAPLSRSRAFRRDNLFFFFLLPEPIFLFLSLFDSSRFIKIFLLLSKSSSYEHCTACNLYTYKTGLGGAKFTERLPSARGTRIFPVNRSGRGERKGRGAHGTAIRPRIYAFRADKWPGHGHGDVSDSQQAIRSARLFCIIRIVYGARGTVRRGQASRALKYHGSAVFNGEPAA